MKRIGRAFHREVWSTIFIIALLMAGVIAVPADGAQNKNVTAVTEFPIFNMRAGDPATGTGPFPMVNQTVFDGLITLAPDRQYLPSLAKSWKISPDWKTMDFFLRDDVRFQNGDPLTAEDVKFSFETYMRRDLKFQLRQELAKKIAAVEAVDPYHIRIRYSEIWLWVFDNYWYQMGIMPKKYREAVGDKAFGQKPIGTGPFTWEAYQQDVFFKLRAVKHHFRKTPEIETLTVRFVSEPSTRMAMLKAGEADIVKLSGTIVPQVKADSDLTLFLNKYVNAFGIWFGDLVMPDKPSPFLDIRVREAASLAIDREAICEKILFGIAEPPRDYLSPLTLGYNPKAPYDSYDPEKAKALLAAAGYPNGFKTTMHMVSGAVGFPEAVAANLKDVGIDVRIQYYEFGALLMKMRTKSLGGLVYPAMLYWNSGKHPAKSGMTFWTRGQLWCYNSTPEIEAAVQKAVMAFSDDELAKYGREMADRIRESRIVLPLFAYHSAWGLSKKIKKWEPVRGVPTGSRFEYLELKP